MIKLRRPKANRQPGIADALHELLVRTTRRVAAGVLSPATLAMQQEHARYLLEHLPRALRVERITAELLEQLVAAEEKGRRVRADGQTRALSGGTIRKRLSTLRQALELQVLRPRAAGKVSGPDRAHRRSVLRSAPRPRQSLSRESREPTSPHCSKQRGRSGGSGAANTGAPEYLPRRNRPRSRIGT